MKKPEKLLTKTAMSASAKKDLAELQHALRNSLHAIAAGVRLLKRDSARNAEDLALILDTLEREQQKAVALSEELAGLVATQKD